MLLCWSFLNLVLSLYPAFIASISDRFLGQLQRSANRPGSHTELPIEIKTLTHHHEFSQAKTSAYGHMTDGQLKHSAHSRLHHCPCPCLLPVYSTVPERQISRDFHGGLQSLALHQRDVRDSEVPGAYDRPWGETLRRRRGRERSEAGFLKTGTGKQKKDKTQLK